MHTKSNVWITMVQLPAVNTPQFDWCRTKLPNHPQPVAPIFQPEVPAEAVVWAAHHRRRELAVGGSAVKAIVGNKLAPRFADRYLARTGYASQQIADMPVTPGRRDNLFEPVPGDAATHGMFDSRALDAEHAAVGHHAPGPDRLRHRGRWALGGVCPARTMTRHQADSPSPFALREYALLPTANAGSLSTRTGTSSGCASRPGTAMRSSPRLSAAADTTQSPRSSAASGVATTNLAASSGAADG